MGGGTTTTRLADAFFDLLVARRLLAPEEAARLAAGPMSANPVATVLGSGLVAPDEIARLIGEIPGLPPEALPCESAADLSASAAEIRCWLEDARTIAEVVPGEEPPASPISGSATVGAVDSWYSAVVGLSSLAPASPLRIEVGTYLRAEAGREVREAEELDLARPVELHRPAAGTTNETMIAAARVHARLAAAAAPVLYEAGTDPEGRAYLLLSAPQGETLADRLRRTLAPPAAAAERREALRLLEEVARALARAHAIGVPHLGIAPDSVHLGRHGQVLVTGWGSPAALASAWGEFGQGGKRDAGPPAAAGRVATGDSADSAEDLGKDPYVAPEVVRAGRGGAASDVYALGVVLAEVSFGRPLRPVRKKRYRPLPGVPAELVPVIRKATARRPGDRYRDAGELARDLSRALSDEPVAAERSPLSRRLARSGRRHPYALVLAGLLVVAGVAAGAIVALHEYRALSLARERDARARAEALERAASDVAQASLALAELQEALASGGAGSDRATLVHRARFDEVCHLVSRARENLAGLPGEVSAEEAARGTSLAGEAAEVAAGAALACARAEIVRARSEEEAHLSSRTVSTARSTRPLYEELARSLDGRPRAEAAFERALVAVGPGWREAARALARLLAVVSGPPWPREEELRIVLRELAPDGVLLVGRVPDGVAAELREIGGTAVRVPGEPVPLESGMELHLPVGEYLAVLSAKGREVRHSILLSRGVRCEWVPDWPPAFPPGDQVYVPPGPFRAGGGSSRSGPYREERMPRGFFIGRHEVSLAEYMEFLEDFRARGDREGLVSHLPWTSTATGVERMLSEELDPIAHYEREMPAGGVSLEMATDYAAWLSGRTGGGWRYRLPTEAEWEYAARGAAGREYPWGDAWDPTLANTTAYPNENGRPWFLPVRSLPEGASVFGLIHASGNVREWTTSPFFEGYVAIRGGSFADAPDWARSAERFGARPRSAHASIGFRLICER